jgi:hypothetical protein
LIIEKRIRRRHIQPTQKSCHFESLFVKDDSSKRAAISGNVEAVEKVSYPYRYIPYFVVARVLDIRYFTIYLFKEPHATLQAIFIRSDHNDSGLL